MAVHATAHRIASAAALLGLVAVSYVFWARPTQMRWGATAAEVARAMPGDELSDHPTFLATRAITINRAQSDIWPWLVQMGYNRAGFYGYDILENICSTRGLRSAETIVTELQHPRPRDVLPLSAAGGLVFHSIAPPHYLIWSGESGRFPGAFTWALYPVDAGHTRLVSRIQWTHHWTSPTLLPIDLFTEFTDHMAVRKILAGVKDRAEGRVEPLWSQTVEFFSLVWALFFYLAAVVSLLRRPVTIARWLIALCAGAGWLIVWYAPVGTAVGIAVNVANLLLLRWNRRSNTAVASTRVNHVMRRQPA
jgi:hypothetical protein